MQRNVSVAHTNNVCFNAGQLNFPLFRLVGQIFIHGIARRGMHQMKTLAIQLHGLCYGQLGEVLNVGGRQNTPVLLPSLSRQSSQS